MELPQDFKDRVRSQLGDAYKEFIAEYEKERVYGLRYNPLKIEKDRLARVLSSYQIVLEDAGWAEEGFYYAPDAQPGKLPLHEAGAYYIQEPSAMIAVTLLDPRPGDKVLDLCAAPGGKSTQIAGRLHGAGLLVSNEIMPDRAKALSRNIERMGITNAVVLNETPERLAERYPVFFDRIVVDAPCSGEGMFRKDVNARGEWSLRQVEACAARQREILPYAVQMLKPGGVLVYSTCTFAPEENEEMAAWLVDQYPQLSIECSRQIWPHRQRGEGHFAARFCKDGGKCSDTQGGSRNEQGGFDSVERDASNMQGGSDSVERDAGNMQGGSDSVEKNFSNMQGDFDSVEKNFSNMQGAFDSVQKDFCSREREFGSRQKYLRSKQREFSCKQSRQKSRAAGVGAKVKRGPDAAAGRQSLIQPALDFFIEALSPEKADQLAQQISMGRLEVFGGQLYVKPADAGRLDGLKVLRAGLQLGCCKKNRFEPSHALAMALRPEDAGQVLDLEAEDQKRFLRGETLSCSLQNGWTLVTVEGCSIGWGKAVQGVLKNHYPKGLRRG